MKRFYLNLKNDCDRSANTYGGIRVYTTKSITKNSYRFVNVDHLIINIYL